MLVAYYSKTGNVKRFIDKVTAKGLRCVNIIEHPVVDEKFVLVTPTHGFGKVPDIVEDFLKVNNANLIAVASSGNKNWGSGLFANSGETVAKEYNVPLLLKFENSGFPKDVESFVDLVSSL